MVTDPFRVIDANNLTESPFSLIGESWMLVTAGPQDAWNTMTASWGGLGVLWHKNVCTVYVRPTRYTFEFMERCEHFTLSFFEEAYRDTLQFCGSHSGREVDKAAETGLTPFEPYPSATSFREARLILVCRKIYSQDLDPSMFFDPDIEACYPERDYHRVYTGELLHCLVRG